MIHYKQGNLFDYVKYQSIDTVVLQCCNNIGVMGAGIALEIAKRYPNVKRAYQQWYKGQPYTISTETGKFKLGEIQEVTLYAENDHDSITFVNMIAQDGIASEDNPHPFNYEAFDKCMFKARVFFHDHSKVFAPLIGAGLAGGDWTKIAPIIERYLGKYDLTVCVLNKEALPIEYREKLI